MKALLVALLFLSLTSPAFSQAVGNGSSAGPATPINSGGSGGSVLTTPHFEIGAITNASVTCTLLALCTVATITFKTNYISAPFCAVLPVAGTAAVSWTPTISSVGTSGFTVNAVAAIALVTQALSGAYLCAGQ